MIRRTKNALIVIAIAGIFPVAPAFAGTIPAGTTLIVQTLDPIYSTDRIGTPFTAKLIQDVAVKGNAVLRAGTKVFGKVESSQAAWRRGAPLTLNLTGVLVNGRTIPIETVSASQMDNKAKRGRAGRRGISVGPFIVTAGKRMGFVLAKPVEI